MTAQPNLFVYLKPFHPNKLEIQTHHRLLLPLDHIPPKNTQNPLKLKAFL